MPDPECKTAIIRILAGLEKTIDDTREPLTTEIKDLKTSQAKIKSAITEMQNLLDTMTMRMEEAEDRIGDIGDIEDKIMENNETEKEKGGKTIRS